MDTRFKHLQERDRIFAAEEAAWLAKFDAVEAVGAACRAGAPSAEIQRLRQEVERAHGEYVNANKAAAQYLRAYGWDITFEGWAWAKSVTLAEALAPVIDAERRLALLMARHTTAHRGTAPENCEHCKREYGIIERARESAHKDFTRRVMYCPAEWWKL